VAFHIVMSQSYKFNKFNKKHPPKLASDPDKMMRRLAVRFLIYGSVVFYLALDLYWLGGPLRERFDAINESREGVDSGRVVASVFGEPVTIEEVDEALLLGYYQRGGDGSGVAHPSRLGELALYHARGGALDMLIYHRVIEGKLRVNPVLLKEEETERLWRHAARSFGGVEAMEAALADEGLDVAEVRRRFALGEQTRRWIERVMERSPGLQPEAGAIEHWFGRHVNVLDVPGAYRLRHLFLPVDGREEDEIIAELEDHRQAIVAGADFADLAAEFSGDHGSAGDGGQLGWCLVSELPEGMRELVGELEVGELSGPVRTAMGYHLVEVLESAPGRPGTLAEWEDRINLHLMTGNRQHVLHEVRGHLHRDGRLRVYPENISQPWSLDKESFDQLESTINPESS